DVDRDAPAVVVALHAAFGEEGDDDPVGVTGEGLVDRVVDDLVDQVVEACRAGRTDIHARTPPHMLPALEDLDLLGGVRDVRAQGVGPAGALREGLSNRHLQDASGAPGRGFGPPSAKNFAGSTGQNFGPSILPDFEYENGPPGGP